MMNRRKQGWCFDGSEVVDVKPSSYKVFVKKVTTSVDFNKVRELATGTLKMKKSEADSLCEALQEHGEWVLGTYHADLAETIVQDLSASIRALGLELGISPLRE